MGFHFSGFAHLDKIKSLFEKTLGLTWTYGSDTTGQFRLNPCVNSEFLNRCGPDVLHDNGYIKANHIANVRPEDRVFVADSSRGESPVVLQNTERDIWATLGKLEV
ncbi:uncharacterized protein RCO7_07632 [Rhynchosporium graminicola]|uniref:Uncharacterized protein n=1 Tax=Rhynchosporium graminicola TaxID=2792576 RepID=A0A1E1L248_9HELO|nr:uncharacterized protein RCO7_07632 [Rhynchosporium commune]